MRTLKAIGCILAALAFVVSSVAASREAVRSTRRDEAPAAAARPRTVVRRIAAVATQLRPTRSVILPVRSVHAARALDVAGVAPPAASGRSAHPPLTRSAGGTSPAAALASLSDPGDIVLRAAALRTHPAEAEAARLLAQTWAQSDDPTVRIRGILTLAATAADTGLLWYGAALRAEVSPDVRATLAAHAPLTGDPAADRPYRELLLASLAEDRDAGVRLAALEALADASTAGESELIAVAAETDPDPAVRLAAVSLVAAGGAQGQFAQAALVRLALRPGEALGVRLPALQALASLETNRPGTFSEEVVQRLALAADEVRNTEANENP
ncbi:MAG: hypothetical protein HYZ53_18800 [Planctomycetes bacterium]|nr:hypothetical protein [Planctomycetota bacterium]